MVVRNTGNPSAIPPPTGVQDPVVQKILWAVRERVNHLDTTGLQRQINQITGGTTGGGTTGGGTTYPRPNVPSGLAAQGIFGAIILTIGAMPGGAYYLEWLAADTNDLGAATVIGTSSVPIYKDYVGSNVGRYYWVRAVGYGQNPLRSAVNKTAGTYGHSAADPSAPLAALSKAQWQPNHGYESFDAVIPTSQTITVTDANSNTVTVAFRANNSGTSGATEPDWTTVSALGDTVADNNITWEAVDANTAPLLIINGQTFIDTALIRTASIKDAMIENLGANKITATSLAAISANLGTVSSGTFKTDAGTAYRAEMSSIGNYPFWLGSGLKTASNAIFYVDTQGNSKFTGQVEFTNVNNRPQTASGLVNKGTFDDQKIGGWQSSTTSVVAVSGQDFGYALQVTGRNQYEANNQFPVQSGDEFWGEATLKASADYAIVFGLAFYDYNNNQLSLETFGSVSAGSGFTNIKGQITAPLYAVKAQPWISLQMPAGTPGESGEATNLWVAAYQRGADVTGQNTAANSQNLNGVTGSTITGWIKPNSTLIDGDQIFVSDAFVNDILIKGNALTVPVSVNIDGSIGLATSWKSVISLTDPNSLTSYNANLLLSFGFTYGDSVYHHDNQNNPYTISMAIYWRMITSSGVVLVGRRVVESKSVTIYGSGSVSMSGQFNFSDQVALSDIPAGDNLIIEAYSSNGGGSISYRYLHAQTSQL